MSIRKFIIQICGVFLSMSLSKTIEKIITSFDWFTLIAGILIFFLSLNFFFAKFKQLQESEEIISLGGFVANILTLSCFAAMPFLIDNFFGLMCAQLLLRTFDICLIFHSNKWKIKNIDKMECRWLCFDFIYFIIICGFIAINEFIHFEYIPLILVSIYLIMGVFESLFDFIVNRQSYGLIAQNMPSSVPAEAETAATASEETSVSTPDNSNVTTQENN